MPRNPPTLNSADLQLRLFLHVLLDHGVDERPDAGTEPDEMDLLILYRVREGQFGRANRKGRGVIVVSLDKNGQPAWRTVRTC